MMDCMQQGILRLLQSAISGQAMSLPENFDLVQALPLIKKHQLGNLIYYGAANCGMDSKSPVSALNCKRSWLPSMPMESIICR